MVTEGFRKSSKDFRRFPKITEGFRIWTEDFRKLLEGLRTFSEIFNNSLLAPYNQFRSFNSSVNLFMYIINK